MSVENAHLSIHTHKKQVGLLLWSTDDTPIPKEFRSAFARGSWCEGVQIMCPNANGEVGLKEISGWFLGAFQATPLLASIPMRALSKYSASVAIWTLASKWVLEAIFNEKLVIGLSPGRRGISRAMWRVATVRPEDRERINVLAETMPGVARAIPPNGKKALVHTASSALQKYMDWAADGLLRADSDATTPRSGNGAKMFMRLAKALAGPDDRYALEGVAEQHLPESVETWTSPVVSWAGERRPIVVFRLSEPRTNKDDWRLSYHLLSVAGNARLSVEAFKAGESGALEVASAMIQMEETLLTALARVAPIFEPVRRSLDESLPAAVLLTAAEAWQFLTVSSVNLESVGYVVEVPKALSRVGHRRVRARMRVGVDDAMGDKGGRTSILKGMISYSWEVSLGDDTLTTEEFRRLADSKAPLVRHRGQWVAIDPNDVARLHELIKKGGGDLDASEALRLALAGQVPVPEAPELTADVVSDGAVQEALEVLHDGISDNMEEAPIPRGLVGQLRPYQVRGYSWIRSVTGVGFGACLADDMGLGKTVQVLCLMQSLAEEEEGRRFLVISPTSVIGNWIHEIRHFVPQLRTVIHHGSSRASSVEKLKKRLDGDNKKRSAVMVTSYALVRGDQAMLAEMDFDLLVLDEAQNIKNPDAAQSHAVRKLRAPRKVALTGTPIENRLTELWSILDFLNSGLLGSRGFFKRVFALPVERYGDEDAAARLRRVTAPFILRRLKTDPNIVPELPEKGELTRFCPMTHEQAALYQVTLERALEDIANLERGMQRRGKILAMLTGLKQICNHPAHYLGDQNFDVKRSGKLIRFLELFRSVLDEGGQALVFTQYRVMGDMLSQVMTQATGREIPFLHGGLSRTARERLVTSFQTRHGPPAMIVSLRAGGTGLNLTRANHIFHYDRWWNPAVEDQATDRAFRIGQTRDVTVHRLVTRGTLEEQIHQLLREKRDLADQVVGTGETWLSELDDLDLHELVNLSQDALLEDAE